MSVKTYSPVWGASFFKRDQIRTGWDSRYEEFIGVRVSKF